MEVERTIEFILQAQAQQAATLQTHAERMTTLTDLVGRLAQAELRLAEEVRNLADAQVKSEERFRQNEERFRQTDERFRETNERLNALITIVDEIIRRDGRKS